MEINIWNVMAPAFFECLVLVGIHSYLGLHVIRRKVIFVDLALAQIAALGTTVGFLFGIMPGSMGAYWFSLIFTFLGAAIFSISRFRNEKIPQEAIIGITYAIAAAVAILVIDKAPHGAEHIKEILTGSILWVKWSTIAIAAIVYAIVGLLHYIFRKQFILISENPHEAVQRGMSIRFWDFLFYMTFGIVITHSVGTAGVLLVFVFLVVPAVIAIMLTDSLWKQLIIGWTLGLAVSIVGLMISYVGDLPSGPTVVSLYGLTLILTALFLYFYRSESRNKAALRIALGTAITLIVFAGFYRMGRFFRTIYHQHEHHTILTEDEHLLHEVKIHHKLSSMTEDELEDYLDNIGDTQKLHKIFDAEPDKFIRFKIALRLANLDRKTGLNLLLYLLETCKIPFLQEQIISEMRKHSNKNFGYDPENNDPENKRAFDRWKKWINSL